VHAALPAARSWQRRRAEQSPAWRALRNRVDDGPLFRLKAPVRAVVFPFVVGGTFTAADGASVRVGSTLPWGAAWRLQFWPWGAFAAALRSLCRALLCSLGARAAHAHATHLASRRCSVAAPRVIPCEP
jgi:hypothetical protein